MTRKRLCLYALLAACALVSGAVGFLLVGHLTPVQFAAVATVGGVTGALAWWKWGSTIGFILVSTGSEPDRGYRSEQQGAEMNKMIFFNIGWMKHYQGLEGDSITGGGSFIKHYDYPPCEVHNFQPYEGHMYGFVRVRGSICIDRLGASRRDDSIDGILVVWVAKSPSNGTVVIGWFKDATVYRDCQPPPEGSGRKREGRKEWGYRVSAEEKNCMLLPPARRTLTVPRGRGGMGQANLWYADKTANDAFRQKVRDFISREEARSRQS